ncbi:DUF896 domain-containing protein [Alicyclobacillus pomorum]|uniref:DUF896 domain-containing protein n=1 Tax=Alicyclobacillus pomorum TaxID=204470 RepID=UPI000420D43E|nr:DUF896 domain-containing protein [Alicyclobacillus pomorum]
MLSQAKLQRINELARKKKTQGLTPSEAEEQRLLREEYLAVFRKTFRDHLDRITVVEADHH